jgi:DNA modification methylase
MEDGQPPFFPESIGTGRPMLPKPYYETELGTLYHGDCIEILPYLEPVDLVLTDPPYGINYTGCPLSKRKGLGVIHDGIIGDKECMDFRNILNMNCDVVIFGANNFPEQLPHRGRWICWDKRVVINADRMKGSSFELAWRNCLSGFDEMYRIMHGGVVNSDGGKRKHPTQKPVELFYRIITDHYLR